MTSTAAIVPGRQIFPVTKKLMMNVSTLAKIRQLTALASERPCRSRLRNGFIKAATPPSDPSATITATSICVLPRWKQKLSIRVTLGFPLRFAAASVSPNVACTLGLPTLAFADAGTCQDLEQQGPEQSRF